MKTGGYLPPWVLQVVGLVVFLFFVGFWAVTGRVEPTLLAASGGLIGAGLYADAKRSLATDQLPTPPPPSPATDARTNGQNA